MLTLAFDTATEILAVSLGNNGKVICEEGIEAGRSHLEMLLPSIQNLLKGNNYSLSDIDRIVAGIGPGTFSGLRVGVSTARALAQTLEIPLSGFSTLEAMALELNRRFAHSGLRKLMPLIDAKRGQVFTQFYRIEGEGVIAPESDVLCLDPVSLVGRVGVIAQEKVGAGGNGAIPYRDAFAGSNLLELLPVEDEGNRVHAGWLLHKPGSHLDQDVNNLRNLVPMYVREPDADKTILLRKKEPWLK